MAYMETEDIRRRLEHVPDLYCLSSSKRSEIKLGQTFESTTFLASRSNERLTNIITTVFGVSRSCYRLCAGHQFGLRLFSSFFFLDGLWPERIEFVYNVHKKQKWRKIYNPNHKKNKTKNTCKSALSVHMRLHVCMRRHE